MLQMIEKNAQELDDFFSEGPASLNEQELKALAQVVDEHTHYSAGGWLHIYHDLASDSPDYTTDIPWKARQKMKLLIQLLSELPTDSLQENELEAVASACIAQFKKYTSSESP